MCPARHASPAPGIFASLASCNTHGWYHPTYRQEPRPPEHQRPRGSLPGQSSRIPRGEEVWSARRPRDCSGQDWEGFAGPAYHHHPKRQMLVLQISWPVVGKAELQYHLRPCTPTPCRWTRWTQRPCHQQSQMLHRGACLGQHRQRLAPPPQSPTGQRKHQRRHWDRSHFALAKATATPPPTPPPPAPPAPPPAPPAPQPPPE
mmetsp:Transcript_93342/g.249949  ORF Transcript_93342/g.249949 Transcript_93342/m.249949 type:complete len:203 (+) Transcript_93342:976-1584(+)